MISISALRRATEQHYATPFALALVLMAGCASDPQGNETSIQPADTTGMQPAEIDAGAAQGKLASPCEPIAGNFERIYDPSAGELWPLYINDHTFVRGPEQQWHLFGITHTEPELAPKDTREFAHASSTNLNSPMWTKQTNALKADPALGESLLWAPHVIEQDGLYWMFYSGGGGDDGSYQIRLATSSDLVTWTREESPLFIDGYEARDPFVLRVGAQWVMYYTATDDPAGGHHIVAYRSSADLRTWSARAVAYIDPMSGKGAGPTESPFVVARDEGYYLFIASSEDYLATRVFFSADPLRFAEPAIAQLKTHAPEIVHDLDGKQYISHAGWGQGGVFLAPLSWHCASD